MHHGETISILPVMLMQSVLVASGVFRENGGIWMWSHCDGRARSHVCMIGCHVYVRVIHVC